MSDPLPIGPAIPGRPGGDVRAAIARASQRTGVDFDYLLAQAKLESNLEPTARARTSSATGLYQFTQGTWLQTLERHGSEHGLDIGAGKLRDPALRSQVLALRNDPELSSMMAAELASDNREGLTGVLGREPDAAELYMAHFLGLGGATTMLRADPGASAAALLPQAASANRPIFYSPGGAARTVGGVMELLRGKVHAAMEGGSATALAGASPFDASPFGEVSSAGWAPPAWNGPGSTASSFAAAPAGAPSAPPRPSMAETLRSTFGLGGNDAGSAPGFVHAAYGRLRSFGL